jgi:hypothetical protein
MLEPCAPRGSRSASTAGEWPEACSSACRSSTPSDGRRKQAELNIAFLPRDSKRDGWVSFRDDPRRGTLSLGAVAFEVP